MAKDPVLVVLQLSGGNDYLNTVIPYSNSLYWENRSVVNIPEDKIVQLDDKVGFNPSMAPLKATAERRSSFRRKPNRPAKAGSLARISAVRAGSACCWA